MPLKRLTFLSVVFAAAPLLALPTIATAQVVSNPSTAPDCMNNTAFFNPALPPSINLPAGFRASVFAAGLNAPTGIAFWAMRATSKCTCSNPAMDYPACVMTKWRGQEVRSPPTTHSLLIFLYSIKTVN